MATTADLRVGAVLKYNNEPCLVLESQHRTPGNLRAFYQVKLRNLRTGRSFEERFRSGESLEFLRIEKKEFQYLYRDGDSFIFMDQESYDQIPVSEIAVGDAARFLKESGSAFITFNDTEILAVELPPHVNLVVIDTEPGVRGDTASGNVMKPGKLETGATIQIPLFVNTGELIRIDTRTGSYMERVKE